MPLLLALLLTLPPDVLNIVLAVVGVNVGLVRLLLFVGVPYKNTHKYYYECIECHINIHMCILFYKKENQKTYDLFWHLYYHLAIARMKMV